MKNICTYSWRASVPTPEGISPHLLLVNISRHPLTILELFPISFPTPPPTPPLSLYPEYQSHRWRISVHILEGHRFPPRRWCPHLLLVNISRHPLTILDLFPTSFPDRPPPHPSLYPVYQSHRWRVSVHILEGHRFPPRRGSVLTSGEYQSPALKNIRPLPNLLLRSTPHDLPPPPPHTHTHAEESISLYPDYQSLRWRVSVPILEGHRAPPWRVCSYLWWVTIPILGEY